MHNSTLLIVEDDELERTPLRLGLRAAGYTVLEAPDGRAARAAFSDELDAVLLDFKLPDAHGLELLEELKAGWPDVAVVMVTGYATVQRAVEAMRHGAFHYTTKPVDLEALLVVLERALEVGRMQRDLRRLQADRTRPYSVDSIIGVSAASREVKGLLAKIATSPASTVLLLGESGTGKGLAARVIHHNSARREGPFMNINCSALAGGLLESELFGHERGAFTDARQQKKGLFELAEGGTLFLDEFTEIEPALQAKLLSFLEEKTFRRVGGTRAITVDVRLVGATNRDLEQAVREGALRKDLYYRLQVLAVQLPPLRERAEDIRPLAEHFIRQYNQEFGKDVQGLQGDAVKLLEGHAWEGNVRELKNAVERAMLFAEGKRLSATDLATLTPETEITAGLRLPPSGVDLEQLERSLVDQALARTRGNRTRAAALLGLSRDQIRYRIEKFGLE